MEFPKIDWENFIKKTFTDFNLNRFFSNVYSEDQIFCEINDDIIDEIFLKYIRSLKNKKITTSNEFYTKLYIIIANTSEFERFLIKSTILIGLKNKNNKFETKIQDTINKTLKRHKIIDENTLKEITREYGEVLRQSIELTENQFKKIFLIIMTYMQDVDKIKEMIENQIGNSEIYYEEFSRKQSYYIQKYKHTFADILSNFKRELSNEVY